MWSLGPIKSGSRSLQRSCQLQQRIRRSRCREFHRHTRLDIAKPFLLADIGEGITECQLIQWFVQPGARVEQFDKICEVQSDKASVEITSPYDGVIKKLHYDPDEMAVTGKPLVDIDIEDGQAEGDTGESAQEENLRRDDIHDHEPNGKVAEPSSQSTTTSTLDSHQSSPQKTNSNDSASLATPAVRHLLKQHSLDIETIRGTGKDGRVLKDDIYKHISESSETQVRAFSAAQNALEDHIQGDQKVSLTGVGLQMFKAMTRSLNIPHFLYTGSADMTAISQMREVLNSTAPSDRKVTQFAFVLKAVSLSLLKHPLLNAALSVKEPQKPVLTYNQVHNFGVAIETPNGLLVPVIHNVHELSIFGIADQLRQLAETARANKLTPKQFSGATFTLSNIGSIGGGVVAPLISEPQVAIVGIGRSKIIPAFDSNGNLRKREELTMSWSADHRVVDGAECARCAEMVTRYLENPSLMMALMR